MSDDQPAGARWAAGIVDMIQLIGLALSVPIAILLVGAPVALIGALMVWVAGMMLGSP